MARKKRKKRPVRSRARTTRPPPKGNMLVENLPLLSIYILGTIIFYGLGWLFALTFVMVCIFSLFWHMRFICAHCLAPNVGKCASGIGNMSHYLFARRPHMKFGEQFKRNVVAQFLPFFLPTIAGGYQLYIGFSGTLLVLVILFCIVAYVILPLASQRHACDGCPMQKVCPYVK